MPVNHEYVVDQGLRMHFLTSGSSVDTLFVHGVGGSAWTFDATLKAMSPRAGWASVDLLGYGSSSWLPDGDYSTARQVRMLRRLLDALGGPTVNTVGFSWGGLIALELARVDRRVSKVAAIDVAPSTLASADHVPTILATYPSMEDVRAAVLALAPAASVEVAAREALLSTRPMARGYEKRIDPALLARWQFRTEDHWDTLRGLTQDLLIVRAEHSPVLSAETGSQMVAQAKRASLVEIPGSGHLIPLERPRELAAVLGQFLDSPAGRRQ